ncbi:MAG: CoA-binding protein, partial [Chloroflexi bacterium]|nr:CoA-binding protein [Chloroflexota bacterium]
MYTQKLHEFEPIFNPRSIAVVGASEKPKAGQRFLKTIMNCGYRGKLYPVNPGSDQILGLKAYPNLMSIPEPVDYVIISVPAPFVLKVLDDCGTKKVKVAHIFSAGFGETGTEAEKKLENEVKEKANRGGFRIIGPNCMGFYNA